MKRRVLGSRCLPSLKWSITFKTRYSASITVNDKEMYDAQICVKCGLAFPVSVFLQLPQGIKLVKIQVRTTHSISLPRLPLVITFCWQQLQEIQVLSSKAALLTKGMFCSLAIYADDMWSEESSFQGL